MSIRTKEQLTQDFEALADGSIPNAVVAASERIRQHLVAVEEEHRAALARARAEALRDAKAALRAPCKSWEAVGMRSAAQRVDALATAPTPASIPVERVREAVQKARGASWLKMGAEAVASDLGIEMEGAQ